MNACPTAPCDTTSPPSASRPGLLRHWWSMLRDAMQPNPAQLAGIRELDPRALRDIGWCDESLPMPEHGASTRRSLDFL
ncbi:MAG TPA: hypothetical protein VJN44_18630 [Roseateles sp.]|nr:hypothetical protein [Roseateles sp.]